jgi:hypothetical protein
MPKSKENSTTIYVPKQFRDRIKQLSERYNKPQWKILLDALTLYETTVRKPKAKEELPVIDKVLWYIQKVSMSIGALKDNPSQANFQRAQKTIEQIRERLGVDVRMLELAINDYAKLIEKKDKRDEANLEINMALKSVLLEIVYNFILKEGEPNQAGSPSAQS